MRNLLKTILAAVLFAMLTACGGGDSGGSGSSAGGNDAGNGSSTGSSTGSNNAGSATSTQANEDNVTATDAQVIANVQSSNIDFSVGSNGRPAGTWRWPATPAQHVLVYIPAATSGNATEQDYATKASAAIDLINSQLSGLLVLEATATAPMTGNFIQVSYGTAYVPAGSTDYQSYCANVAAGPKLANVIGPDSQNGIATSPVYLNLGNGHCNVTQDIVTHEFGHALGLANHFDGFGGDGPSISTAFWDTLATLYANPQSTTASSLVVKRVAH